MLQKVDLNGNSPLHQAAFSNIPGSEEITELLIKAGVDLDTRNRFGRTAADECVVSDNINSLKVLVMMERPLSRRFLLSVKVNTRLKPSGRVRHSPEMSMTLKIYGEGCAIY